MTGDKNQTAAAPAIDNKVKQVISNIRNLPTPPIVFHQIQKVIADPKGSAAQVASILSEDPAMSVKVLKLTNSAFYGLANEVESVKQAVVIVGMEAIRNLVLSASVLDMFKGKEVDQEFQEKFWRHSLATGICSRLLARRFRARGIVDPDAAFSAGLLHDIGKIVMCCFLTQEYHSYLEARKRDHDSLTYEIEDRTLGYNHAQIGALLATQWKLPHKLVEAIAYHHQPQLHGEGEPIAYMVCLANYLAKKAFYEGPDKQLIGWVEPSVLEHLKVDPDELDALGEMLQQEYLKAETFMKMVGIS